MLPNLGRLGLPTAAGEWQSLLQGQPPDNDPSAWQSLVRGERGGGRGRGRGRGGRGRGPPSPPGPGDGNVPGPPLEKKVIVERMERAMKERCQAEMNDLKQMYDERIVELRDEMEAHKRAGQSAFERGKSAQKQASDQEVRAQLQKKEQDCMRAMAINDNNFNARVADSVRNIARERNNARAEVQKAKADVEALLARHARERETMFRDKQQDEQEWAEKYQALEERFKEYEEKTQQESRQMVEARAQAQAKLEECEKRLVGVTRRPELLKQPLLVKPVPWKPSPPPPPGKWWVGLTVAEVIDEPDARGYLLRLLYILLTAEGLEFSEETRARLKEKGLYIPSEQNGHTEVTEVIGTIVGKKWLATFKKHYRVWPAA